MNPKLLTAAIAGVICLVCAFVAIERYQANADNLRAINRMGSGMLRHMSGGQHAKPAMPTASKYAIFFAVISGAVAVGALVMHNRQGNANDAPSRRHQRHG